MEKEIYIEEADYNVTLTLQVSVRIMFSPIERDSKLTSLDAVGNAVGSIPQAVFDELEGEGFEIAYPIEGEATKL